jgi:hypothetical protein
MKIFDGGARTHVRVRQNTSCYNGLSGFVSESHQDVLEWVGNIGYGNGQYGVRWLNAEPATIGCNDWFANRIGAVQGRPFAAGDMAVDPLFCDGLAGDVRLDAASPLLDGPGCGLVGALGAGCGATATLVQRFTAGRAAEGIRVLWEVAEGATASEIWVERADGTTGEAWSRAVMERSSEGRAVAELDRGAALDRVYRYRLVAREGGNVVVLAPGVVVEAQERLEFRLVDVGPNPGGGPVRIAFGLARAAAIEIAVFDLLGRRVASPARGSWPAGTHEVVWSGRTNGEQPAPSGVYLVRYAFPGGQDRRPIVRLH